jgi:hypothetical protein
MPRVLSPGLLEDASEDKETALKAYTDPGRNPSRPPVVSRYNPLEAGQAQCRAATAGQRPPRRFY